MRLLPRLPTTNRGHGLGIVDVTFAVAMWSIAERSEIEVPASIELSLTLE